MWLSRAQVEDLQTSFEFESVKHTGGAVSSIRGRMPSCYRQFCAMSRP